MDEKSWIVSFGGLDFDLTIILMTLLTCTLIFVATVFFSRNLQLKPTGKQNALEMLVDFVRKIVSDNVPKKDVNNYTLLAFTLFLFVLCSNLIGLVTKIAAHDAGGTEINYWKSPTADPIVTLTLATMVILLTNYFGMKKFGIKEYLSNSFAKPAKFLMPIKVMEEFTNVLTLGLRLYGNIFAGEVLVGLIATFAKSKGFISFIPAIPLQMIWIGFSIFIGCIQAFIFVTLSMVYLSHKIEVAE